MPSDERKMAIDAGQDHLDLALDFVDGFHRYAQQEIIPRIHYHLSEWVQTQKADDEWIADPLFSRLPSRLNLSNRPTTLSKLEFSDADIVMLREAMWLSEIARQIAVRTVSDPDLAEWIEQQMNRLSDTQVRDLRFAVESFDWVVRNIQLEGRQEEREFGEACGIEPPRPGELRASWESLLIGRGAAQVRGRLAILLCRQLGVPMVQLAIEPETDDAESRTWALAALIGSDLFLFEPTMGIAIPGPDGEGIATLAEVLEQPELLTALDVAGSKYKIKPDDLSRNFAYIDATIPYLSQRMKLLERRLSGDRKIKLTVSPSSLAQELRKQKGIGSVALWPLPYSAVNYRRQHLDNPKFVMLLTAATQPFSGDTALANGRRLHLAGIWNSTAEKKGAKAYYLDCRVPDDRIENLKIDESMRRVLDLPDQPLPDDPQFLKSFFAAQVQRLRIFKQFASYFLGSIALEEQKYDVAADYFKNRTLDATPDAVYETGARYGLGRTYEAQGQAKDDADRLNAAIEVYESDDSAQAAGSRFRARRLKAILDRDERASSNEAATNDAAQ